MIKQKKLLFYGHQSIDNQDINFVVKTLKGDWLTTGPIVKKFEKKIKDYTGAKYAVCCSSGTAALLLSYMALGDDCINFLIPSMTFVSTASSASLLGKKVHFIDCNPKNGLLDISNLEDVLKKKKIDVIVPVHMNGRAVELEKIYKLSKKHKVHVVDDASHAIGSEYKTMDNKLLKVGSGVHSDLTVFSFHPVKNITTGEGGAITTNNKKLYEKMILYRNHGIEKNEDRIKNKNLAFNNEGKLNSWYYEVHNIGFNLRLSDINSALGYSQFRKLNKFKKKRQRLVKIYCSKLKELDNFVEPVNDDLDCITSWHLFVIRVKFDKLQKTRDFLMNNLKKRNIQTQVHYIPVHYHPYFAKYKSNDLKGTESYYNEILTLPLHPAMNKKDVEYVVESLKEVLEKML